VHAALFQVYRARKGNDFDVSQLGERGEDTMVVIVAPPSLTSTIRYTADDRIDVSATICLWMQRTPASNTLNKLTTMACYTAELELDIVRASVVCDNADRELHEWREYRRARP
jgi:hypothetical protein